MQFPAWFRSRRNGWLPFGYILVFDQKQAKVTDSQLICYMHSVFDSSASRDNFSKGCAVQDSTGLVKLIRARARILLDDCEQHVRAFNLTGYNGSNACGVCSNVLGRCRPFVDPLLVHLHSSEYHKFRYHTPASLAAQADDVKHVAEHTPGRLRAEQQASGLKYEAVGLMWNLEVRTKMEPPYCEVQDWMHTYAASGGVAQYHVNGFVNAVTANTAITLDDIDEWKNGVVLPKGVTKLKPNFFRDRIVEAPWKTHTGFRLGGPNVRHASRCFRRHRARERARSRQHGAGASSVATVLGLFRSASDFAQHL